MAEFSEVMRQAQRMCDYRRKSGLRCNDCDAVHICGLEIRHVGLDTLCADADAVMLWAAEHPEPVYETWFEYLLRIGVIPENAPAGGVYQWIVESIKHKPIPADIAQKLGLKPKEV